MFNTSAKDVSLERILSALSFEDAESSIAKCFFKSFGLRFDELLNHLKSVDVLLLDDLGSENMTPWLRDEILGPVLNYRLMEEKPVFVSSNMSINDLKIHLNVEKGNDLKAQRIISRLTGLVKQIELDNNSYKR